MNKKQTNFDEIQNEYLDTMIKLAIKHGDAMAAQTDDEEGEDVPAIDEARKNAVWAMAMEKYAKMDAAEKKKHRIVKLHRFIPRMIHAAACLVLVMGIAAPLAVANVEAIRIKVMELLIHIQEDHTELQLVENEDEDFYVPANWQGSYYPSYIPEGFNLVEHGKFVCYVRYQEKGGKNIYYTEYNESDKVDINSENAALSYSQINGHDVFVIERDDMVIATWAVEDRYIVMETELSKDEALNIIQNVRKIF